jgi:hypothetical protein
LNSRSILSVDVAFGALVSRICSGFQINVALPTQEAHMTPPTLGWDRHAVWVYQDPAPFFGFESRRGRWVPHVGFGEGDCIVKPTQLIQINSREMRRT